MSVNADITAQEKLEDRFLTSIFLLNTNPSITSTAPSVDPTAPALDIAPQDTVAPQENNSIRSLGTVFPAEEKGGILDSIGDLFQRGLNAFSPSGDQHYQQERSTISRYSAPTPEDNTKAIAAQNLDPFAQNDQVLAVYAQADSFYSTKMKQASMAARAEFGAAVSADIDAVIAPAFENSYGATTPGMDSAAPAATSPTDTTYSNNAWLPTVG